MKPPGFSAQPVFPQEPPVAVQPTGGQGLSLEPGGKIPARLLTQVLNNGVVVGLRRFVNLIAGAGTSIVFTDSPSTDSVNVTITGSAQSDVLTTKGDLLTQSANGTYARLGIGTTGQVLAVAAGLPAWQGSVTLGSRLAYVEFTGNVAVTATTEAGADVVVSAGAVTYAATRILIEFFGPNNRPDASGGQNLFFVLFDGSTSLGQFGTIGQPGSGVDRKPVKLERELVPSAGSHTYKVGAFVDSGAGQCAGGVGGSGNIVPGFIKVTSAV